MSIVNDTLSHTLNVIGNIPEPIQDECYSPDEYQRAKAIAMECVNFVYTLSDKIDSMQTYKLFVGDEPKIEKFDVMSMIDTFTNNLDELAKY